MGKRFLAVFAVAALTLFALLLAAPVRPFIDGFSANLAGGSAVLIRMFGGVCVQSAATLRHPASGFAMEVRDGCNGVNVVILLWAAMLAYPASARWKLIGLGAGLAAIQTLNLLRLISLFYLGQFSMSAFEFAHLYLWETLIILDGMVVFAFWARRART
jgi:exosortase H (IPTLxxWG-CTERM-specific)